MDSGKSLILGALKGEKGNRTPVAILDGYTWMLRRAGLSFRNLMDMGAKEAATFVYEAYNDLQSDIVQVNAHLMNLIFEAMGGTVEYGKVGEAVEVKARPLTAPIDIREFNADEVWCKVEGRPEFIRALETTRQLRQMANEDKALVAISFAPFSLAAMLLGVQQYMEALLDEEEGMDELSEFALDMTLRFTQAFVNAGAEIVFVCDPVASGDLISPTIFEQYTLPLLKRVVEEYQKQNIPVMLHICGNTRARLAPLCECGFVAFSLDSVDLRTALDTAHGNYAIMGNMSPSAVMLQMEPEAIEAHCRNLIHEVGDDANFILMPGCDLGPLTPIENVQAMVRAAHNG